MNVQLQQPDIAAAFEAVPHFPNYLSERARTGATFDVVTSVSRHGKGEWKSVRADAVRMYSDALAAHLEIVLGPRGRCTVSFEPDKGEPQRREAHYSATPQSLTITNFEIRVGSVLITAFEIYRWNKVETYIKTDASRFGIYLKEPKPS